MYCNFLFNITINERKTDVLFNCKIIICLDQIELIDYSVNRLGKCGFKDENKLFAIGTFNKRKTTNLNLPHQNLIASCMHFVMRAI